MVNFRIMYADGKTLIFHNVSSVSYISYEKKEVVVDTDLEKFKYPIGKPIWLSREDGIVCISGDDVRAIEVQKA